MSTVAEAAPAASLVVVSGPSGVGKSTVVARALQLDPSIWLSVSATTRAPRAGEIDGREYFFVSDERFDELVATDGLLEWAQFAGNRYGTPREPVERQRRAGHPVLLEIEVQGARQVRRAGPGRAAGLPRAAVVGDADRSPGRSRHRIGRGGGSAGCRRRATSSRPPRSSTSFSSMPMWGSAPESW